MRAIVPTILTGTVTEKVDIRVFQVTYMLGTPMQAESGFIDFMNAITLKLEALLCIKCTFFREVMRNR